MDLKSAISWKEKSKLYVSLAAKPGKTGETFYNTLFKYHKIDAEYVACKCTDLKEDLALAREHCAGISITMPFKQQALDYIDSSDNLNGAVNTIVNDNKKLIGYNCDFMGIRDLLGSSFANKTIVVLGDGAMARNFLSLMADAAVTQHSRKMNNWEDRHRAADILVNTTSVGMAEGESPVNHLDNIKTVVDCVIGATKLYRMSMHAGRKYISGADLYLAQFAHQFKIYTGIEPDKKVTQRVAKELFLYD